MKAKDLVEGRSYFYAYDPVGWETMTDPERHEAIFVAHSTSSGWSIIRLGGKRLEVPNRRLRMPWKTYLRRVARKEPTDG